MVDGDQRPGAYRICSLLVVVTVLALPHWLRLRPGCLHPCVSDDTACVEILFRTARYRVESRVERFADFESVRAWTGRFVCRYNDPHLRSGTHCVSPADRDGDEVLNRRHVWQIEACRRNLRRSARRARIGQGVDIVTSDPGSSETIALASATDPEKQQLAARFRRQLPRRVPRVVARQCAARRRHRRLRFPRHRSSGKTESGRASMRVCHECLPAGICRRHADSNLRAKSRKPLKFLTFVRLTPVGRGLGVNFSDSSVLAILQWLDAGTIAANDVPCLPIESDQELQVNGFGPARADCVSA
jgi:hypothetical protein